MQSQFKVKTKLSYSPGKVKDNVYVVRAKLGKKIPSRLFNQVEDKFIDNRKPTSLSTQKLKSHGSKLFKNAHKIQITDTYLPLDKNNRFSVTNQSSPPHSPADVPSKIPQTMTSSDKTKDRMRTGSKSQPKKDIQRTISIAYKGKAKDVPVQQELMTSLTKLILGDEKAQDDFYLEVLGQSSIHGDEENFIDFGQSDFFNESEVYPITRK